jgi:hypothetical protein
MRSPATPEIYREILLPRRSGEIIGRYETMTEPEIRTAALSVLENPVFQWVLASLQEETIHSLRIIPPGPDLDRLTFMLAALDAMLGAFIGQAFETRGPPDI